MDRDQMLEFETMLTRRKRDLEEVIAANEDYILNQLDVEQAANLSKAPTHPADAPVNTSEQDKELNLISMERDEVGKIIAALERIHDGSYGVCEECDVDIPMERLRAIPFTRHCVSCEEELEAQRDRAARLRTAQ